MSSLPPIYEEHGKRFRADTCLPVAHAADAGEIYYRALVHGNFPGNRLPRTGLQEVRNVGFWDVESPQDWGLDWHRNEGIEITFLEHGKLAFAVDRRTYRLRAGDLTFTRPWQRHRVGGPNVTPSRLHWLILDVGVRRPHQSWKWPPWVVLTRSDLRELTSMMRRAVDAVWHVQDEISPCFARIARAVEKDRAGDCVSRLAVHLNELLVLLLDLLRQGQVTFDRELATVQQTVELFWEDMRKNLTGLAHPWTVREMAQRCGMGVTQFTRQCRHLTNMTPMELLCRHRIETATRMLLTEPQKNVTSIAFDCGFSSSQYFAKVFRRLVGCCPTEYRRAKR